MAIAKVNAHSFDVDVNRTARPSSGRRSAREG
jgi:hypothetical protein